MKTRTCQVVVAAVAAVVAGGVAVAVASSQRNGDGRSPAAADASPSAPSTSSASVADPGPSPGSGDRPRASSSVSQSLIDSVRDPSSAVLDALTEQIEVLEAAGKQDEADRLKARRALLAVQLRPGVPRPSTSAAPTPPGATPSS